MRVMLKGIHRGDLAAVEATVVDGLEGWSPSARQMRRSPVALYAGRLRGQRLSPRRGAGFGGSMRAGF
jgi:uncharacterized protein (DUF1800 family)